MTFRQERLRFGTISRSTRTTSTRRRIPISRRCLTALTRTALLSWITSRAQETPMRSLRVKTRITIGKPPWNTIRRSKTLTLWIVPLSKRFLTRFPKEIRQHQVMMPKSKRRKKWLKKLFAEQEIWDILQVRQRLTAIILKISLLRKSTA